MDQKPVAVWVAAGVATVGGVLLAIQSISYALLVVMGVAALVVVARKPRWAAPLFLSSATLFARPDVFGNYLAPLSLVLVGASAVLSIAEDVAQSRNPVRAAEWVVPIWIGIAYAGIVIAVLFGAGTEIDSVGRGVILTVGTLVGCAFVLADPIRRILVAKMFVALVGLFTASYVVSLVLWVTVGVSTIQIGTFDTGVVREAQPLFFPFTTTVGSVLVPGDLTLPRFTGFGREPGWMAMYAAFAYFLAPKIGWTAIPLRALLLIGLLGTLSTSGFAVFAVVAAYEAFFRYRSEISRASRVLLRTVGLAAMSASLWVAFNAPVVGIDAKRTSDRYSYGQRLDSTLAGIEAAFTNPFAGGSAASIVGGVNLIASIALYGILFVAAVTAAIWLPRFKHPDRAATTAPVAVVFLTLLTAQPPADATWAYVCVMIAYAATRSRPNGDFASSQSSGSQSRIAAHRPRRVPTPANES